ncbi:MAG: helix-turn-helix transcriptional regulator [Rhodospirillaceae bacterium]|jgi:phage repressor protein C with HTH and peptisase S24 domain|nr:helix-turn-helix transcriptional regulator [Rhodospirillaceae bacterium]
MFKHGDIWDAVDRLAAEHHLSASGLAKKAGLDPTTFNKSKRHTRDGKPRWPGTESIAKILGATGSGLSEFVGYIGGGGPGGMQRIPVIGYAQAGQSGFFDDGGYPVGSGWDEIVFPNVNDPTAYALEISGDSMEPLYRDGDTIIISPATDLRRGDRVVAKTHDGEVMVKELVRRSAHKVELRSINPDHNLREISEENIEWLARVIWASQ